MRFKMEPVQYDGKYRHYSSTQITEAYNDVKINNMSVYSAAKKYRIPEQTLRDRVLGKIDIDVIASGRSPTLSLYEEAKIVDHLDKIAKYGYGYTRQEVVDIATDYAVQLGKRTVDKPFTQKWYDQFAKRWPKIRVIRPRALELQRAKGTSRTIVDMYFNTLEDILDKYSLRDKPHLILNVDEKGISENHKPPYVVCSGDYHPQAVTTGKSQTTTIIGCGSASGVALPPYFVFAGKRKMPDLMNGASPGADIAMSETGWSNTEIFRSFLKDHFMKYAPKREPGEYILLLLDGHKSHVAIDLVDWAVSHDIILFILPAHTSHVLQPLDVSCYGPLETMYNGFCHTHTRGTSASVTRYDICQLGSMAYVRSLSAEHLFSGFRKCGIYPFNRDAVNKDSLCPADVFQNENINIDSVENAHTENDRIEGESDMVEQVNDRVEGQNERIDRENDMTDGQNRENDANDKESDGIDSDHDTTGEENGGIEEENERDKGESPSAFLAEKLNKLKSIKSGKVRKVRNTLSKVVSGKPITETEIKNKIIKHLEGQEKGKKRMNVSVKGKKALSVKGKKALSVKGKKTLSVKGKKALKEKEVSLLVSSPKPGPSYIYVSDSDVMSDSSVEESEKCCVCKLFTPSEVRNSVSFVITKWVQCDSCAHWVHLGFCTKIKVVRRGDRYECPHCE